MDWDKLQREDVGNIGIIADRVIKAGLSLDRITINMDLSAAHIASPLRLPAMAKHEALFDLMHDVIGINRNINRHTGEMQNCFLPRFAV